MNQKNNRKQSGTSRTILGKYYTWKLFQRNGVYYADGRTGNNVNLSKHSLGVRDRKEAMEQLSLLDEKKALEHGLIEDLSQESVAQLPVAEGIKQYLAHVGRPKSLGGASAKTIQRYHAVFDKLLAYLAKRGIRYWQQVNTSVVTDYISSLDKEDYAYATQQFEVTTILQCHNYLTEVQEANGLTKLRIKPGSKADSNAYCYSAREVDAIVEHLSKTPGLRWLHDVVVGLIHTGLRISELRDLTWDDVDMDKRLIRILDESRYGSHRDRKKARTTKGGRSRELAMHDELIRLLCGIKHGSKANIFYGPKGGMLKPDVVRTNFIKHAIRPLAAKFKGTGHGKSFKDARLHSFRHYFCSICADAGVPEQMLMAWLGHKDSQMIRRYYHVDHQRSSDQMQKIQFMGHGGSAKDADSQDPHTPRSSSSPD